MELSKYIFYLELIKRLKELGVKQESEFYWVNVQELPTLYAPVTVLTKQHVRIHCRVWVVDCASRQAYNAFVIMAICERW